MLNLQLQLYCMSMVFMRMKILIQLVSSKIYPKAIILSRKKLGQAPRALVWPYGSYSEQAWNIAKNVGYSQSLVLEKGENILSKKSEHINRFLISDNPTVSELSSYLEPFSYQTPERVVHVDLDYVYDSDKKQQEINIGKLVERINKMRVTSVYLQAFADQDADGNASELYFPNRFLPVKEDLFNRVAWQLKTRAGVRVYAWLPVSAFDFGEEYYEKHGVKAYIDGRVSSFK